MKPVTIFLSLLVLSSLLPNKVFTQAAAAPKIIPLPTTLSQSWAAVVQLFNVDSNSTPQLIGYGFFINRWTVLTSNQLLQDARANGSLRLTIQSVDGKTNYRPLVVDLVDKGKDLVKIEVRERSSVALASLETEKMKPYEKVFTLRRGSALGDAFALEEISLPFTKELRGLPLFNEAGRLVGMGIDPLAKSFIEEGTLLAKNFSRLVSQYGSPYKNGKLICIPDIYCEVTESKQDVRPIANARIFTGNLRDESNLLLPLMEEKKDDPGKKLQGKVLRRLAPPYPPLAKSSRIAGSVLVHVVVDEQGEIIFARPVSGPPSLQPISVEAARQYVFDSAIHEGKKVRIEGFLTFNFIL